MYSLKAKIILIGAISGLIGLILASGIVYSIMQGTKALAGVYENQVQPVSELQDIDRHLKEIRFRMAGVLLDQMPAAGSKNQLQEARAEIPEQWKKFKEQTANNQMSDEAKDFVAKIDKQLISLPDFFNKLNDAYSAGDKTKLTSLLEDEWPVYQGGLLKPISLLIPFQQAAVKQAYEKSVKDGSRLMVVGVVFAIVSLIVTALLSVVLFRAIMRPLRESIVIAKRVADGDLTQKINVSSGNEFSGLLQALYDMNSNLLVLVGEVREGTQSISAASAEIASGNMNLSSRTESQASSLEETAAAMEELTSTVKQNSENAKQGSQLASSASQVAQKGNSLVMTLVETMGDVNNSASKISDIIGVIDGIAFQTNILALNAAVEAARAGEQGRGFAVVASEVRNLAQRSAAAAREIKALIDTSVQKISQGNRQVTEAGSVMNEVLSSVQKVSDIMSEISSASFEQSQGIDEVNNAVTLMDENTQQNAALVEEAAAAAQAMQHQSQHLETLVNRFQLEETTTSAFAFVPTARPSSSSMNSPRLKH
jgi:methyl-accepting chemotaxis protein